MKYTLKFVNVKHVYTLNVYNLNMCEDINSFLDEQSDLYILYYIVFPYWLIFHFYMVRFKYYCIWKPFLYQVTRQAFSWPLEWVECWSLQRIYQCHNPRKLNVTLFRKKVFTNVIKLKILRWHHLVMQVSPMASVLRRDRREEAVWRWRERLELYNNKYGTHGATGSWKRREEILP